MRLNVIFGLKVEHLLLLKAAFANKKRIKFKVSKVVIILVNKVSGMQLLVVFLVEIDFS